MKFSASIDIGDLDSVCVSGGGGWRLTRLELITDSDKLDRLHSDFLPLYLYMTHETHILASIQHRQMDVAWLP